jgi:hypothetical protein
MYNISLFGIVAMIPLPVQLIYPNTKLMEKLFLLYLYYKKFFENYS